jgi:ribosomal protein S6
MAPLYEVIMLTKCGADGTSQLKKLLKTCATHIWDRGGVLADIRPWGSRELAYRIRAQQKNEYYAQYTSLHVYTSPTTLQSLEGTLRNSNHVLRHLTLKQESMPKLDKATRFHGKFPYHTETKPAVDLEADPTEAARWEYRNLVMQRVFEGRTKSDLVAEQLVRHRFQHAQPRPPPEPPRYSLSGPLVSALRRPGEPVPVEGEPAPVQLPPTGDGGDPPPTAP